MKLLKPIIILLISSVCLSCGYRTAPEPYQTVSVDLPKIKDVKLNFRGEALYIRWSLPVKELQKKSKPLAPIKKELSSSLTSIDYFRINIYKKQSQCYSCKSKLEGIIRVYPQTKKIESEPISWKNETEPFIWNQNESHYELGIPSDIYLNNIDIGHSLFTIDFVRVNGDLSTVTNQIEPVKPIKIPLPVVQVKKRVLDKNKGFFLYLSWQPQYETVRHVIAENGNLVTQDRFYGLNLYRINKYGFPKVEYSVNSEPLREGTFSLSDFHEALLYGRYVDRYGNESEKVLIFNGEY